MPPKDPMPYIDDGSDDDSTPDSSESVTTRVLKGTEIYVDGAKFHWWAIGESQMLVTVRSKVFGSTTGFTEDDPEEAATKLAKGLLQEHYKKAKVLQTLFPKKKD